MGTQEPLRLFIASNIAVFSAAIIFYYALERPARRSIRALFRRQRTPVADPAAH